MEAIFSAKLFRTSPRQAAIKAALEDPINQELVLQLRKYLDEDEVQKLADQQSESQSPEVDEAAMGGTEDEKKVVQVTDISETSAAPEQVEDDEDADDAGTTEGPDESEDVTSSFAANMVNVTAAEEVTSIEADPFVVPTLDTVQGQLNAFEDTCGVIRTKQVGDELWIYFNDKKNLNNLMEAVIDRLGAAGFYQLEFNRLARTDNAIVFQIANISTEVNNGETEKASSN